MQDINQKKPQGDSKPPPEEKLPASITLANTPPTVLKITPSPTAKDKSVGMYEEEDEGTPTDEAEIAREDVLKMILIQMNQMKRISILPSQIL